MLFNEDETRLVLKFIFAPTDHELIDSLPLSDGLREFAQGLLVEAIDTSYAIGFVQALHEATANPAKGGARNTQEFRQEGIQALVRARHRP